MWSFFDSDNRQLVELTATLVEGNQIDLSWKDNTDRFARYDIEINGVPVDTTNVRETSYSIKDLNPNTKYEIALYAKSGICCCFKSNNVTIDTSPTLLGNVVDFLKGLVS